MARSKRYRDNRQKRDGSTFIALPLVLLESSSFIGLGAQAMKLLINLYSQYNGHNNGYLCCCFSAMQPYGWKSKDTLHKAKTELLQSGLIVETRKGGRPNRASYYAVTWYALDEQNGKTPLDISPKIFPRGLYRHPQDYEKYLLSPIAVPAESP